jgi:hypothetical protein
MLRQAVAGKESDLAITLEGKQADTVELALEHPFRTREAILRERRGHRDDPVGKLLAGHASDGKTSGKSVECHACQLFAVRGPWFAGASAGCGLRAAGCDRATSGQSENVI